MADFSGNSFKLSGSSLSGLMRSILDRGASFRFQASGSSMTPFIRDKDILTVSTVDRDKPRVGDVAAVISRAGESVIVHRIIGATEEGFLFKGDNLVSADGVFLRKDILGIVTKVERNGKNATFGIGRARALIAFLSGSGILNALILPLLRGIKRIITAAGTHSR